MKIILILILFFHFSLLINTYINNNNYNTFVNCEQNNINNNNNILKEMTGINDIINKRYKEYVERNPNIQQSTNNHYERENDPIRGHLCDHDKIMQRRMNEIQESNRRQRELEQQQLEQQQNEHQDNNN